MKRLTLILLCSVALAQTKLTPTELETEKLGKLKAQLATVAQSVETVKAQIQVYQAQQFFLEQQKQHKQDELDAYASKVIKSHTEWGKAEDISYNDKEGESGVFNKREEKKEEKK
jgi:hypothetical protein